MASNNSNSLNSNDALHMNVRVKVEPGTSVSPIPSTSSSLPSMPFSERVSIKTEPGLPITTTTQRLVSYRLPRDLTLGGNMVKPKLEKPKKVYMPNLNVQRNKKKDDPTISVKAEPTRLRQNDRGKERARGDRGRGKRDEGNIIESVGVWSEGVYTSPTVRKKYEKASSSTARYSTKPKLKKSARLEEKKLNNLTSDDLSDDCLDDERMCPLTLPRVKKEVNNMIDNDKIDKKLIMESIVEKERKQHIQEEFSISQIIENKAINSYTLIQFPSSFPALRSSREEVGSKQSNNSNTHEGDNKAKPERCTLNNLKSGLLGKLEILKSGKARLRLGEINFFVDIGVQQRFQQDLLAVKIDATSQTGDLINLGPVNNKLVCSADFESILKDL
ncbi:DNA-directed RNA polymerase III subunit RPC4 [Monomorium pharaonis]|uniref:DNA-directed RNA polymerase III subunit RPC4 n=1 Tax=Monomorium pharaonis TaxID=307658 RepID=UPI00063ED600|nr:DNA-directed RNA polymerase III subunit RPC4 [Monomorium pharaonis]XP_036143182.1 DNA-directed RNA polymerase III subunit RPC4 [Monomorium pharaonis]